MDTQSRNESAESTLQALMVRGLSGDRIAYEAFLKELSRHLRAFLRKRLSGLPDDVEDLVQETLIAVHSRRHTYDTGQPLTAWVHAIAKYKLVDHLRARAARGGPAGPIDEDCELFAATDDAAAMARRDVARLLERLPERQRLPIACMKLEGLSVAETARATGMSQAAVKVGVHRGLKALAMMVKGTR